MDINKYNPCFITETVGGSFQKVDLRIFERIPYFLYRQTFALSDCWGVARMFYACHGWRFDIDSIHNTNSGALSLLNGRHWMRREFEEVPENSLDYGDLVTFGGHVFVFLGRRGEKLEVIGQSPLNLEILTSSGRYLVESEKLEAFSHGRMKCWKRDRRKTCKPYKLTAEDWQVVALNYKHNPYSPNGIIEAYATTDEQTKRFLHWRGYDTEISNSLIEEKSRIDRILERRNRRNRQWN